MRRTLRTHFADVLTAVLAASAGAAAIGCSSAQGPDGPGGGGGGTQPEYVSACTEGESSGMDLLAGLRASPPIDGAIRRSEAAFLQGGQDYRQVGLPQTPPNVVGDNWTASNGPATGALCAKATNQAACLEKVQSFRILPATREECVAKYPQNNYSPNACAVGYILYTRGDEIGVARTNEETKALIGTFDTLAEAMWAATLPKGVGPNGYPTSLRLSCGSSYPAGLPQSEYRTTADGGYDIILVESENCGKTSYRVMVHVDYAGNVTEVERTDLGIEPGCAVAGRRPEGFRVDRYVASGEGAVGEYFASMAALEAASVVAFRRLRQQLASFGAPRDLLDRITKAAKDEVRHARATRALAKKFGVTPCAPVIADQDPNATLLAIALENAREGQVRETYGALVAHHQMARAADPDVRRVMSEIADEETDHAELSWDIATWIESQLGDSERALVASEREKAFVALAGELTAALPASVIESSGVPSPTDALRLLAGLEPLVLARAA